jgi:hypothetical protein
MPGRKLKRAAVRPWKKNRKNTCPSLSSYLVFLLIWTQS